MGRDINSEIRALLRTGIKNSPMSRERIAEKLTEVCGFPVSINMLNDWCAPSKDKVRFPLSLTCAICEITGSDDLALLPMPDSLREQAELGKALQPFLEKWAEKDRASPRAKRPRKKGGSK